MLIYDRYKEFNDFMMIIMLVFFLVTICLYIVLFLFISQAIYLICDKKYGPIKSMSKSIEIVNEHYFELFELNLCHLVVFLAGIFVNGILLFIAMPFIRVQRALFYLDLCYPDENIDFSPENESVDIYNADENNTGNNKYANQDMDKYEYEYEYVAHFNEIEEMNEIENLDSVEELGEDINLNIIKDIYPQEDLIFDEHKEIKSTNVNGLNNDYEVLDSDYDFLKKYNSTEENVYIPDDLN